MSTQYTPIWIDPFLNKVYAGWQNSQDASQFVFKQGDKQQIELFLIKQGILGGQEVLAFPAGSTIRLAIGKIDSRAIDGTMRIGFDGDTTTALAFNATDIQIDAALNALPSVISAGGVTVDTVSATTFQVSFVSIGSRPHLALDTAGLVPSCGSKFIVARAGSPTTKAVYIVKVFQSVSVYQSTWTDSPEPAISVEVLATNRTKRVTISPVPLSGSWSLDTTPDIQTLVTEAGNETSVPTYWTQTITERVSAFEETFKKDGSDIWQMSILRNDISSWDFSVKTNYAIPVGYTMPFTVSGNFIKFPSKVGTIDLNTLEVEYLLNGASSVTAILEIEVERSTGEKWTVLQIPCTIVNDLIDQSSYSLSSFETLVTDAPTDGSQYARKDGDWVAVELDGNNIPDYDNSVTYTVGNQVYFQGKLYRMVAAAGAAGYDPVGHPSYWESLSGSNPDLSNYLTKDGGSLNSGAQLDFDNAFSVGSVGPAGAGFYELLGTKSVIIYNDRIEVGDSDIGSTVINAGGITFPDATVQTTAATSPDLTGYATQSYVTSQGYITSSALTGYATLTGASFSGTVYVPALRNLLNTDLVIDSYNDNGAGTHYLHKFTPFDGKFVLAPNGGGLTFPDGTTQTTASDLTGYATETFVTSQGYATGNLANYVPLTDLRIQALDTSFIPLSSQATVTYSLTYYDGFFGGDQTTDITITSPVGYYNGWTVILDDGQPAGYYGIAGTTITLGCNASTMQDALSNLASGGSSSGWTVSGSGSPYAPSSVLAGSQTVSTPSVSLATNNGMKFLLREELTAELSRLARQTVSANAVLSFSYATKAVEWNTNIVTPTTLQSYAPLAGATFTGKVNLATISVASPSINLGGQCDTAPASAANGDLWISNATAPKLTYRMNGVNYNLPVLNQFNTFTNQVVIDTASSSVPALRVTQRSTGDAIVVEDSTSPDADAFIINAVGRVGIGVATGWTATEKLEVKGNIKFNDGTVQSTAFTTAQLPTSATTTEARFSTNTTKFLTPNSAHWLLMNPNIIQIQRAGFTVTNTGTITFANAGWISSWTRLGQAGACSSRWRTFGTSQIDQTMSMTDKSIPTSNLDFSNASWCSGRSALSGIVDSLLSWGFYHGKAESDGIGVLARRGYGWRATGGAGTRYLTLEVHNGTTLTSVTSAYAITEGVAFDWDLISSGTGTVTLYVNGTQVATSTAGPTGSTNITPVIWQEEVASSGVASSPYSGMAHSRGKFIAFDP